MDSYELQKILTQRCGVLKTLIDTMNMSVQFDDNLYLKSRDLERVNQLINQMLEQVKQQS